MYMKGCFRQEKKNGLYFPCQSEGRFGDQAVKVGEERLVRGISITSQIHFSFLNDLENLHLMMNIDGDCWFK